MDTPIYMNKVKREKQIYPIYVNAAQKIMNIEAYGLMEALEKARAYEKKKTV